MSVKVHEAFSIDSFQDRLLWWDDFLGDQIKDEWATAGVGVGGVAVIDAQTGGIVRLNTGAVTTNWRNLQWGDVRSLLVTKKASMEMRVKLNQVSSIEVYLRLRFDVSNQIFFRFDDSVDNTWQIQTTDGGASTVLDSGITPDTDYHIFRIECFPTDEVHFYIDGVETANSPITTNIPDDAADYLQPSPYIITEEDADKSIDVDYVVVRQEV